MTTSAPEQPVLDLVDVKRHFGGVKAVDGVDLAVAQGSVVAIIGPNGAGKSTIFNLLMGTLPLTSGEILLNGQSIKRLPTHQRTRLGMGRSFQITSLFPELSLCENVQMPLVCGKRGPARFVRPFRQAGRDEAIQLLDEVGLAHLSDLKAGMLSHGDKKRLEIAIVLALRPRLLLLDEPTAGMAAGERSTVMDLVVGIVRRRGLSMVFTEHDMDAVMKHAERLVVLDRGRKLADGLPRQVRDDEQVREVYLGYNYRPSESS
jgi:ABC-type branched-subunit amino acid transport system ATPase component